METQTMTPAMALALQANFASVERWREEFIALAHAPVGGSEGVRLVFQPHAGTLVNQPASGTMHAVGKGVAILAFELAAGQGVDAFMEGIDWARVYERYQGAVDAASEPLAVTADELSGAHVLDVRRAGVFEQADALIPGAQWRDPGQVGSWCAQLPRDKPVIVYCVYGHEVGRTTAMRLRAAGVDAKFLRGGIDGWKSAGRPLTAKKV